MTIREAILQIQLRADKWDDDSLVKSFVNIGPIIPMMRTAYQDRRAYSRYY